MIEPTIGADTTALALAREGAAVALAARNADRLAEVRADIEAAGGRAIGVSTNVVDPDACAAVCAEAVAAFGGLDIVVNSAFRGDTFQRVEDADMATWHKIFEVNFFGAMNLSRAAIPHLRNRGGGSIINIASMSARKVREAEAGYAASKAALITASQSMALELADHVYLLETGRVVMSGPSEQIRNDESLRKAYLGY